MKQLKYLIYLTIVSMLYFPVSHAKNTINNSSSPNVVFFLVDDLGWADIEDNGSKIYDTPNINKLANQGVSFNQAYAAHPLCIGSRYAIMTGNYPARIKQSKQFGTMQPKETSLAEAFKNGGYNTFFAGKWHLGKSGAYPQDQGFDINIGGHDMGAPQHYFYPYGEKDNPRKVPDLDQIDNSGDYLTDSLTEKALSFIDANKKSPFFLYLSHYAVHVPLESKEVHKNEAQKRIDKHKYSGQAYRKLKEATEKLHQDNAAYAGMVKSIDVSLGAIMEKLEKLNLDKNTIIVFTSDNGGESTKVYKNSGKATSNQPLKAGKCWLYEGGIRVPLIVRWPGKVPANIISKQSVTGVDHFPTLLELAGLPLMPNHHEDGRSYMRALIQKKDTQRDSMYWHFPAEHGTGRLAKACGTPSGTAIRDGNFKLINWYNNDRLELYNLSTDIGESRDIAQENPMKTKALLNKLVQWQGSMGITPKHNSF